MTSLRTALTAKTTSSNSAESDRVREVLHDVAVRTNSNVVETVRLLATDPLDAMDRVRLMEGWQYNSLPRVN
jgi:hypothetical protein